MKRTSSRLLKYVIMYIAVSVTMVGCTLKPRPPFEVESPEKSMLFGNIKIQGHDVTSIGLREFGRFYLAPFVVPPRVMTFKNGNFVAENIKPGSYYISDFISDNTKYTLVNDGRSAYQWIITVEPGSLIYVGSYTIDNISKDKAFKGDFNLKTVRHPTERVVLKHLFEITKGTGWQARVDRRIKSLQ